MNMSGIWTRPRALARDRRGNVAVMSGLVAIPMMGSVGFAVDYSVANTVKTELQNALDVAVLAGARQSGAAQSTAASAAFAANYHGGTAASPSFATNADGSFTGTLNVQIPTTMGQLVGQSSFATKLTSTAYPASAGTSTITQPIEVAVMLDASSSMSQSAGNTTGNTRETKFQAMQAAVTTLVNTVVQTDQTIKTRVALVPFSSAVNLRGVNATTNKSFYEMATGVAPTTSWASVVERAGASAFTDDAPAATKYFTTFATAHSSPISSNSFFVTYVKGLTSDAPPAYLVPLSGDKTALTTAINGLSIAGTTAGHLGTAWAWYALSPNFATVWGAASAPAAYGTGTKVAVLMSDFDFNTSYNATVTTAARVLDVSHASTDSNGSYDQALAQCTAMKNAGITVYTVGFQVDTTNADSVYLFNNCASDASKAIVASDGNALLAAFTTVGNSVVSSASTSTVSSLRLAK